MQICERVVEDVATTFIRRMRDELIVDTFALLDWYNRADASGKIFEFVVSNFDVLQLVDLRRLIVCVVDRALYNWFHLLQSTNEIQLLIVYENEEGTDEAVNLLTCAPHLPQCLFGAGGWVSKYSCLRSPYTWAEEVLSLWDYTRVTVVPLRLPPLPDFPDASVEWYERTALQQAAMDKFGSWLIQVVRDKTMDEWLNLLAGQEPEDVWLAMQARSMLDGWAERLQRVRRLKEDIVFEIILSKIDSLLHSMLYIIHSPEYAIMVETPLGRVYDLKSVPMLVHLAAELFGDEGWIARFSRYPRASVDRDAG